MTSHHFYLLIAVCIIKLIAALSLAFHNGLHSVRWSRSESLFSQQASGTLRVVLVRLNSQNISLCSRPRKSSRREKTRFESWRENNTFRCSLRLHLCSYAEMRAITEVIYHHFSNKLIFSYRGFSSRRQSVGGVNMKRLTTFALIWW